MKRVLIFSMCLLVLACFSGAALAGQGNQSSSQKGDSYYGPGYHDYGPGYGMGPGMMGGGRGGYGMGPGMMGGGRGGYGMGPGMMGGGRGGYGMRGYGPNYHGWQSMPPADRQAWQQMYQEFQKDTLKLRQKLVAKHMELQTLWNEPKPDQARMRELSKEVSELQSELAVKRNEFLLQCRQKFGDKGWTCPGGGY
ncbi:MAG: periplasmic heavy metal sensor [Desulfarculaceae bacterium]|nr:periplasmic heavy metal sensor [Desulfarculaceae bacterium]MCF8074276.1 periplasmic heavy metal sensor [Desulfarculaceae bacterium]MCF8102965.1 periplasmic heavy metal sensor [Desulfarculaceae bacterium]MCF8117096.1 periplasmic heavy metal sensor [Desulfarculaceae bacterium]